MFRQSTRIGDREKCDYALCRHMSALEQAGYPTRRETSAVSYPKLSQIQNRWIESVRLQHDPQARRLNVHFTLVFPFNGEPTPLAKELEQAAMGTCQIVFAITRSTSDS